MTFSNLKTQLNATKIQTWIQFELKFKFKLKPARVAFTFGRSSVANARFILCRREVSFGFENGVGVTATSREFKGGVTAARNKPGMPAFWYRCYRIALIALVLKALPRKLTRPFRVSSFSFFFLARSRLHVRFSLRVSSFHPSISSSNVTIASILRS